MSKGRVRNIRAGTDRRGPSKVLLTQPVLTVWLHDPPVTLGDGVAAAIALDPSGLTVRYRLSYEAITPFFAFRLWSLDDALTLDTSFLINADLVGAPGDRAENVMVCLLKNSADSI